MKLTILCTLVVLLVASLVLAQQQPSNNSSSNSTGNSRGGYSEQFGVLSERNMFVKDRVRGRGDGSTTRPSSSQPTQTPLTPEESYILRGVVYENEGFIAYFENLNTSRMEAVSIGAELAQTRVADIAIDAVLLEKNGQTQWIMIGRDLRGELARQTVKTSSAPTSTTPGTAAPGSTDPNTLSIEERLRQRRAQERGGR